MKKIRRISYNDPGHVHFLTFSCFRRSQAFVEDLACELFAVFLNKSRERQNFDLWAYVFMPDHIHLLIRPRRDEYSMSRILKSIKGPFARRYVEEWKWYNLGRLRLLRIDSSSEPKYRVWQKGGRYDRNLFGPESIKRAIDYIEYNPVRRGFITAVLDWKWSSARERARYIHGILPIDEVNWELIIEE